MKTLLKAVVQLLVIGGFVVASGALAKIAFELTLLGWNVI